MIINIILTQNLASNNVEKKQNSLNEITNEEDFKDINKSITDLKDIKEDVNISKTIEKDITSVEESVNLTLKDIKEEVNISKTIEKEIKSVEESVNLTNQKNENLNKEKNN